MKTPHEFFSQNPSLEDCKTRFGDLHNDGLYVLNRSLLHIFAERYTGCNPIPIIQWLMGPPYCLVIDIQSSDLSPTPLMVAGYYGKIATIKALVKCGANVNATVPPGVYHGRNRGYTVLEYVLSSNKESKEAVLCLLDLGANRIFANEVPLYVGEFLAKKRQLRRICILLLGLRFRRLHPHGFEKRLLPLIARLVWAQRFEI